MKAWVFVGVWLVIWAGHGIAAEVLESRKLRLTCHLTDAEGNAGRAIRFDLDLESRKARVACVSDDGCGMHVVMDVWKVKMSTAGRLGGISLLGSEEYRAGYVTLFGAGGEEGDLMAVIGYGVQRVASGLRPRASVVLMYAESPSSGLFAEDAAECGVELQE